MALLGIDIGGTKLAAAVFTEEGEIISREVVLLEGRGGKDAGSLVAETVRKILSRKQGVGDQKQNAESRKQSVGDQKQNDESRKQGVRDQKQDDESRKQNDVICIRSIGISVPGIYRIKEGTVWAPNIPGWDNYPLLKEVQEVCAGLPVTIDSDRACYILGEMWKGNARGCSNAIFLSVGTGIGAGILADGRILRGANDIAGAIGWLALSKPFRDEYVGCGCFEHHASGEGIAKIAREYLSEENGNSTSLSEQSGEQSGNQSGEKMTWHSEFHSTLAVKQAEEITAYDVFAACSKGDPVAARVLKQATEYWGMAIANLISLFNPEKIIIGGGVFGPAVSLIPEITKEAARWAQPISSSLVSIEESALGGDAGVYGAAWLAREKLVSGA